MNLSVSDLVLSAATTDDAVGMADVIRAAFGARPALDPPSSAVDETPESMAESLRRGGGVFATVRGVPAGVIVISAESSRTASFRRVSVHPGFQQHGIASAMVTAAEEYAAELGFGRVMVFARKEFSELIDFWVRRGFSTHSTEPTGVNLVKSLPVAVWVESPEDMRDLGARISRMLIAGDLVTAHGELGAGKTTFTQGIGAGLGIHAGVISPTFVLSRFHRSPGDAPDLVHVDAYRLASAAEFDDLDLETAAASCITVVEWGEGMAEGLADSRLEVSIRQVDDDADHRLVVLRGVGRRWHDVDLESLRDRGRRQAG